MFSSWDSKGKQAESVITLQQWWIKGTLMLAIIRWLIFLLEVLSYRKLFLITAPSSRRSFHPRFWVGFGVFFSLFFFPLHERCSVFNFFYNCYTCWKVDCSLEICSLWDSQSCSLGRIRHFCHCTECYLHIQYLVLLGSLIRATEKRWEQFSGFLKYKDSICS